MPIKNNTTTNSTTPINPGNSTINPVPPQSGIEPNEPLPPDPSVIPESSTGGPLPDPNSPDASGSDPGPFPNPSSGSAEPGQGPPADPNLPPPPGSRLRLLREFRFLQSGTSANPQPPQNNQPTPNPTPNQNPKPQTPSNPPRAGLKPIYSPPYWKPGPFFNGLMKFITEIVQFIINLLQVFLVFIRPFQEKFRKSRWTMWFSSCCQALQIWLSFGAITGNFGGMIDQMQI